MTPLDITGRALAMLAALALLTAAAAAVVLWRAVLPVILIAALAVTSEWCAPSPSAAAPGLRLRPAHSEPETPGTGTGPVLPPDPETERQALAQIANARAELPARDEAMFETFLGDLVRQVQPPARPTPPTSWPPCWPGPGFTSVPARTCGSVTTGTRCWCGRW
ncbi:hypothetical protein ACFQ0O_41235 [Saccharopolyspora spinosporotrichia]